MIPSHSFSLRLPARLVLAAALDVAAAPLPAEPAAARDIGLVLSGGGAKGAYEVGVWLALDDLGLTDRVAAISGTSVGAINAAAFASGLPADKLESVWVDRLGGIFALSDSWIQENLVAWIQSARADESSLKWKTAVETALGGGMSFAKFRFGSGPLDGALDPGPLEAAIAESIPAVWPENAPVAFATAVERNGVSGPSLAVFRLNEASVSNRVAMVCASTAIPFAYPARRVGDKYHLDGGTRVPGFPGRLLNPAPLLTVPGIKTIIAVYLDDKPNFNRRDEIAPSDLPAEINLVPVFPSENIGGSPLALGWQGVFDASPETAKHLIELGRKDAREALRKANLAD